MRVSPYIFFNGNCREAIEFYSSVFDSPVTDLNTFGQSPVESKEEEKDKIMHARISIGTNNVIMFCDNMNGDSSIGNNIQLSVEFDDMNDMNTKFAKLAQGGKITMELQDTFWGARFGMLKDKFDIRWMFNMQLNTNPKP